MEWKKNIIIFMHCSMIMSITCLVYILKNNWINIFKTYFKLIFHQKYYHKIIFNTPIIPSMFIIFSLYNSTNIKSFILLLKNVKNHVDHFALNTLVGYFSRMENLKILWNGIMKQTAFYLSLIVLIYIYSEIKVILTYIASIHLLTLRDILQ